MFNHLVEKLRLSSLRTRYGLAAILLAIILLIITSATGHFADQVRQETSNNILQRKELLQQARHVRDSIWDIEKSLQAFLLDPNTQGNIELLKTDVETSLQTTDKLLQQPWVETLKQRQNLAEFHYSLQLLASSLANLVNTRLNPRKQFPALIYSRDTMLPLNSQFVSAINLALDELFETEKLDRKTYSKLVHIRHLWIQNISNFRMYLANRLGSFDETTLPAQRRDIYVTLDTIQNNITELKRNTQTRELGLQTIAAIEEINGLLAQWRNDFDKVVAIHSTDKWRADASLLRNSINPLFDELWNRLQSLDMAIESSTDLDIQTLTKASHVQTNLLWSMFAMGLIFILAVYIVMDRMLLKPIRDVVTALQAEAHGDQATILPSPNSQETLQLIDAFSEMHRQIHNRQHALEYQALHDSLTGLANRHLLFDRLQQAIQHARRESQSLAFYILDLDRFKEINDTLGHQVGDRLLEEVGLRLTETLRDTDTVARLGGDEFAILIEDCDESKAKHVANKILSAFERTYTVDNLHLYLDVSIGISFYPVHDNNAQGLIQRADIAMYVAKHKKGGYAIYDVSQDKHSINRLALGSDLREALETGQQLLLYYQPKRELESGEVASVEALLRWQHPVHGFVPPAEIIPLAEHTGLIQSLTYWVIEEAIKQHLDWRQQHREISIAVNISAYNLQDREFLHKTQALLEQYQVNGSFLTFELTESAMMADPAHAIASITKFCELGIQFAIDDFGTGFSSLSYLKQLPAHELKIDKSFVLNMTRNDNDAVIVRSIIELAHNLSLRVVAEGVEDKDTLDLLEILDCDVVQGFYIQRPVAAKDLTLWLHDNNQTRNIHING